MLTDFYFLKFKNEFNNLCLESVSFFLSPNDFYANIYPSENERSLLKCLLMN